MKIPMLFCGKITFFILLDERNRAPFLQEEIAKNQLLAWMEVSLLSSPLHPTWFLKREFPILKLWTEALVTPTVQPYK